MSLVIASFFRALSRAPGERALHALHRLKARREDLFCAGAGKVLLRKVLTRYVRGGVCGDLYGCSCTDMAAFRADAELYFGVSHTARVMIARPTFPAWLGMRISLESCACT